MEDSLWTFNFTTARSTKEIIKAIDDGALELLCYILLIGFYLWLESTYTLAIMDDWKAKKYS